MAMDMGSGTLGRLTALMPPEKLDALLLSHWHFDHCSDVLPLLFRLAGVRGKTAGCLRAGGRIVDGAQGGAAKRRFLPA